MLYWIMVCPGAKGLNCVHCPGRPSKEDVYMYVHMHTQTHTYALTHTCTQLLPLSHSLTHTPAPSTLSQPTQGREPSSRRPSQQKLCSTKASAVAWSPQQFGKVLGEEMHLSVIWQKSIWCGGGCAISRCTGRALEQVELIVECLGSGESEEPWGRGGFEGSPVSAAQSQRCCLEAFYLEHGCPPSKLHIRQTSLARLKESR